MRLSALKTAFLATLLIVPTSSQLRASGDPPRPPAPPAAAIPTAPPEPPAPPAPPAKRREKHIIVASPDDEIVVDGNGVRVWNDAEDPEIDFDAPDAGGDEDPPMVVRLPNHGGNGYIGMRPIEMTPELRQHFGAPKEAGVLVGGVEKDSPAARAGLEVGDIVTAVGAVRIESTRELLRAVRHQKPGHAVRIEVVRNRAAKTVSVTVGKRPAEEVRVGELGPMPRFHFKGPGHPGDWMMPPTGESGGFEKRLHDLEKRLEELESRLPVR